MHLAWLQIGVRLMLRKQHRLNPEGDLVLAQRNLEHQGVLQQDVPAFGDEIAALEAHPFWGVGAQCRATRRPRRSIASLP